MPVTYAFALRRESVHYVCMPNPKLAPEVAALLTGLLPVYAEDRARWPLWTYARSPSAFGGWTWRGCKSWPDRFRWSQRLPLLAILRGVISSAENAGVKLVGFSPHQRQITTTQGFAEIALPHHARIAALFAATAHPVPPSSVADFRITERWSLNGWMDDEDNEQLGRHLVGTLLHPRRDPLLGRFLRVAQMAGLKPDDRAPGSDPTAEGRKLAVELVQKSGLLPDRKGARRIALSVEWLKELHPEAAEIAEEARKWVPTATQQRVAEEIVEAATVVPIEQERRRRETPTEAADRIHKAAIQLRLPFLLPDELETILNEPDARRAARRLVQGRLTAEIETKTLQNLLSGT